MKKYLRLILAFAAVAGLLAGIIVCEYYDVPGVSNILSALLGAIILYIPLPILEIVSGWKFDFFRMRLNSDLRDKDYVRISFGYAFRIIVDGYYLLVMDKYGKFQSPGGCYRVSEEEKSYLRRKYYAGADFNAQISITETTKNDYRMNIPANKLRGFVRRFHKGKGGETYKDTSREFREELLDTGILDPVIFKKVEYNYLGQYQAPIKRSPYFDALELLFTDVCEVLLNEEQENYIRGLIEKSKDDSECRFRFVTEQQILHCGYDREKKTQAFIMENAYKITDHSFKDLKRCPRKRITYTMDFSKTRKSISK